MPPHPGSASRHERTDGQPVIVRPTTRDHPSCDRGNDREHPLVARNRIDARPHRPVRPDLGKSWTLRRRPVPASDARLLVISATKEWLVRVEGGHNSITKVTLDALLTQYGVTSESHRERLQALNREAQQSGWWEAYRNDAASAYLTYVGYEARSPIR